MAAMKGTPICPTARFTIAPRKWKAESTLMALMGIEPGFSWSSCYYSTISPLSISPPHLSTKLLHPISPPHLSTPISPPHLSTSSLHPMQVLHRSLNLLQIPVVCLLAWVRSWGVVTLMHKCYLHDVGGSALKRQREWGCQQFQEALETGLIYCLGSHSANYCLITW